MPDVLENMDEKGYVVVNNLLSPEACLALQEELYSHKTGEKSSFYASGYNPDPAYRALISSVIEQHVYDKFLKELLPGYDLFYANLLHKVKGDYSECVMHTDWSITDETLFRPLHIWVPLVDVTIDNGTLGLVPGSHKVTHSYRGFNVPQYYEKYYEALKKDHTTHFEVPAGTAVFYHPGMIHYSPPNLTDEIRTAVLLSFTPAPAEPVVYYKYKWDLSGKIRVYPLTKEFYTSWDKKQKPALPVLRKVQNHAHELSLNEFIEKLYAS